MDQSNKQSLSNRSETDRDAKANPVAEIVVMASESTASIPTAMDAIPVAQRVDTPVSAVNKANLAESESLEGPLPLGPTKRSWVFRAISFISRLVSNLFGIISVILLLAVTANVPILNFLSFGYLLEVTGRLARRQKFSDAMIGLKKASVLGRLVLGTWLMLLPIRLVSNFWFEAYLIDPASSQTQFMRVLQVAMIVLVVAHIGAAWLCGGKLRYFFWPLVAPFSFCIWLARRLAGWAYFRGLLSATTDWFAPGLTDDICNAAPVTDWFLPAIFVKRILRGNVYSTARDNVWAFTNNLNLPYYFLLGLKGFVGTFLWLLPPTLLLVTSTFLDGGVALLCGMFGVVLAIPIFAMLPFIQAHFATDGKLIRFLEIRNVFGNFGRSPFAHLLALITTLLFALPLFLLKVEAIPNELLWTLSIVFVVFTWPAKIMVGWAYGRGSKREQVSRWWLRYPVTLLTIPVSFSFVMILMLTRYVSWNGTLSLFENHVFLLPAPFWQ